MKENTIKSCISSIETNIDIGGIEPKKIEEIIKNININNNELRLKIGKINDRLSLFVLILIFANKEHKVFSNFEENIIKLLKKISRNLEDKKKRDSENFLSIDELLTICAINFQNKTKDLLEEITINSTINSTEQNNQNNEKFLKIINDTIRVIKDLTEKNK
jgi:hypothetical protein